MKTELEAAIKLLAERITGTTTAPEALNFTQAALNLAHVDAVMVQTQLERNNTGESK